MPLYSLLRADDRPADSLALVAGRHARAEIRTAVRKVVATALLAQLAAVVGAGASEQADHRSAETTGDPHKHLPPGESVGSVLREIIDECVH